MFSLKTLACASLALGVSAGASSAAVIDTLGTQEFAEGAFSDLSGFVANANGDPDPFNIIFGSDPGGTFGDLTFSHVFTPVIGALSASITIGLLDHDSFEPGSDTIDIFFDGIAQDTSIWEGISLSPASYHVRSMDVDSGLLIDGQLDVRIVATAPAGTFPGNSIGVDFSELSADVAIVPLPASGLMLLSGLGLMAWRKKRS